MVSVSIYNSKAFGIALLTAALSLPSRQFAHAEAQPDQRVVSFKYLHYQESQIGDGINVITVITGAS